MKSKVTKMDVLVKSDASASIKKVKSFAELEPLFEFMISHQNEQKEKDKLKLLIENNHVFCFTSADPLKKSLPWVVAEIRHFYFRISAKDLLNDHLTDIEVLTKVELDTLKRIGVSPVWLGLIKLEGQTGTMTPESDEKKDVNHDSAGWYPVDTVPVLVIKGKAYIY